MNKNVFVRKVKGIFLLLAIPALALAAPSNELRGVGVTVAEDGARVELDTSARTSQKLFTLDHPDRVVIDLRNTRLASGVRMPDGSGVIQTIRTGVRPGGTLRIVIDLKANLPASGKWVASPVGVGKQFVVELGKGAPSVFAGVAKNEASAKSGSADAPAESKDSVTSAPTATQVLAAASAGEEESQTPPARRGRASARGRATSVIKPSPIEKTPAQVAPKPVLPEHAPVDSDRDIIVAVDAGHGGVDPGAIGRNGTREKDVTLAIARALAERINEEPGMRAILIRNSDTFVVLRDRMVRARKAKADMFVSVHADSIRDRSITGASVYVLSDRGASSEAARWLAERENAADLAGGVSLDDKDESLASVLLNLSQTASLTASMTAAERVLAELDQTFGVRKSRVQQAGLVVLKSPDIPSMLVETGYISNPGEEARLKSRKGQQRLADSIFTGLRGYFEVNPPVGTRLAHMRRSTLAGVATPPAPP
jgi:N-acetylmuramoyl-L-alanine amidase